MKLIMATVTDVDGTEAEPITVEFDSGTVTLTGPNGLVLEFDEIELSGAIFQEAHGYRSAA